MENSKGKILYILIVVAYHYRFKH